MKIYQLLDAVVLTLFLHISKHKQTNYKRGYRIKIIFLHTAMAITSFKSHEKLKCHYQSPDLINEYQNTQFYQNPSIFFKKY